MKKAYIFSLLVGVSVLLSACTVPNKSDVAPSQTVPTITESPTPTINQDNSIDQIEADLKATSVSEEDFSDLK